MYKHMLVDGRNMLYRAVFAGKNDPNFQKSNMDYFLIFARTLRTHYREFKPDQIHIFWDDKRLNLWRTKILPTYKGKRVEDPEIQEIIARQFKICLDVCMHMGIRQYFKDEEEADDLIYAFTLTSQDDTIIISSDKDMEQIPYRFNNVDLYCPNRRMVINQSNADDVGNVGIMSPSMKALMGDKSDNIAGYHRIGPKTAKRLADPVDRQNFFKSGKAIIIENGEKNNVGDLVFRRNMALVDLSLNRHLLDNRMYIEGRMGIEVEYDYASILKTLRKYNVPEFNKEAYSLFTPFSRLK